MPRLELITHLSAPPAACFDASRDIDLHVRGFMESRERAIAGVTTGLIGAGQEVVWEGIHFGFRLRHHSLIAIFEPPRYFQDIMLRGVFRSYCHDHYFEPEGDGTRMRDVVAWVSPLGPLGLAADRLFVHRYLEHLIRVRASVIREAVETRG
jgi:ligand-binding SRPBCC domain-containing protein